MRKIKVWVHYPWAGVPDDEEIIEVKENTPEYDIEDIVDETIQDMVWNTIDCGYEEI